MTSPSRPPLRVGMIGYAFMGVAHSHAWRTAPRFFDLPLSPELTVLAGRDPAGVSAAADRLGWASTETDWRRVVERDDVDLVDICTPGDSHAEIAIAALEAGKHVLCEKPLANSVAEAEAMAAAAERAAARSAVATIARASSTVLASGFSHSTCLPASSAATAISAWVSPGEQTSTSTSTARSSPDRPTGGAGPCPVPAPPVLPPEPPP